MSRTQEKGSREGKRRRRTERRGVGGFVAGGGLRQGEEKSSYAQSNRPSYPGATPGHFEGH